MSRQFKVRLLSVVILCWFCGTAMRGNGFGRFVGNVTATWLNDGRQMKLAADFAYVDPFGKRWDAPNGSVVDGASIPRVLWTAIGGPFEGNYRNASVIHDVACVRRSEPWQKVHRMFYDAMRCGGVEPTRALAMYYAVYHYGPQWKEPEGFWGKVGGTFKGIVGIFSTEAPPPPPPPPPPIPEDLLDRVERQIQERQLTTPDQVERLSIQ